jgi:hypothetical protein
MAARVLELPASDENATTSVAPAVAADATVASLEVLPRERL